MMLYYNYIVFAVTSPSIHLEFFMRVLDALVCWGWSDGISPSIRSLEKTRMLWWNIWWCN